MWNCCSFFFRALSFLSGILHSSGHYVAGMFNIQKVDALPFPDVLPTPLVVAEMQSFFFSLHGVATGLSPLRCLILVRYSQIGVCWPVLVLVETTLPSSLRSLSLPLPQHQTRNFRVFPFCASSRIVVRAYLKYLLNKYLVCLVQQIAFIPHTP